MKKKQLSQNDRKKLALYNRALYPARLRYREDTGKFFYAYGKGGERIRKTLSEDLESAYAVALQLRKLQDKTPIHSSRGESLQSFYERWKEKRFPQLAANTCAGYEFDWKNLEILHPVELQAITSEAIEICLSRISGASAREHAAVFISILLGAAVKQGCIDKKPFSAGHKKRKKRVQVLSESEIKTLLSFASESARPAMALAAFAGLRRGEIFGLKAADIDLKNGLLFIRRSRGKVNGEIVEKSTKTNEPRVLPISESLEPYLIELLSRDSGEWLQPIRSDLHRRVKGACARWKAAEKKGGPSCRVETLDMHGLRHVCLSNIMMAAGPAAAQAVAGHSTIKTTADVYGHLTAVYLARAVNGSNEKNSIKTLNAEEIDEIEKLAARFSSHPDFEVAEFAGTVSDFLARIGTGKATEIKKPES